MLLSETNFLIFEEAMSGREGQGIGYIRGKIIGIVRWDYALIEEFYVYPSGNQRNYHNSASEAECKELAEW